MRHALPRSLDLESPEVVRVELRPDAQASESRRGEIIMDINTDGNWIRGFEIVGGFVPFSVAKAVSPFHPVYPDPTDKAREGKVTYDPDADAAFFYLEYNVHFSHLPPEARAALMVTSHCVNPMAVYGLDQH